MLTIAVLIVYAIYNIMCFDYYSHIFMPNEDKTKAILICTGVNVVLYYVYVINLDMYPNWIIYIFYIILYMLETTIIYRESILKVGLFVLTLGTLQFAMKNLFFSVFSFTRGDVFVSDKNMETELIVIMVSLVIPLPLFVILKRLLMRTVIDSMLSNREVLRFAASMYTILYIYLFVNTLVYSGYSFEKKLILHSIKVNILILFIYSISMLYTFIFARLQMYVHDYNQINKLVQEEEDRLSDLNREATTDMLTGFKTRDVAEKAISSYLRDREAFYVVFIDLDGLKSTNDNYGHEEGDFYIKHVAEIITRSFIGNITARIGGDEFLIVGSILDEFSLRNSVNICYDKVSQISTLYKKPYRTSISYGSVFVPNNTRMSMDEIVSLADARMYDFKSRQKRSRSVINPNFRKSSAV